MSSLFWLPSMLIFIFIYLSYVVFFYFKYSGSLIKLNNYKSLNFIFLI